MGLLFKFKSHLIFDLGGTADFTVAEVTKKHTLKHLHYASGGGWGGKKINEAILNKLKEMFTQEDVILFESMRADVLDIENEIEMKKKNLKKGDKLSLSSLPTFLSQKANSKMIKKTNDKDLIKWKGDKLIFEAAILNNIFESIVGLITNHIKTLLKKTKAKQIETILLVGGFANSEIVYQCIKKELSKLNVIVPDNSELAVLRGAVSYGKFKGIIEMRMINHTYGVMSNRPPRDGDPKNNIIFVGRKHVCTNVFQKLISIGDQVLVDEILEREFKASNSKTQKAIEIRIFRSDQPDPKFVNGCTLAGTLTVNIPLTIGTAERAVKMFMQFGKTEISLWAEDKLTGPNDSQSKIWLR